MGDPPGWGEVGEETGYSSDSNNKSCSPLIDDGENSEFHDLIDESCKVPCGYVEHHDEKDKCKSKWWESTLSRAIFAGILAFIYIALFVWLADKAGPIAAGIFGAIPGTLLAAIFFERPDRVPSLVFALILGGLASLASAVVFYWLITSCDTDKRTVLLLSILIWIVVIGVLFFVFRDKFHND